MTDPLAPPPQPEPQPDDTDATETDELVEPTDNGPQPDDPAEQPSQDPGALPPGTVTGEQ